MLITKKNNLRNAIITGGAGFIGSHLLDTLVKRFDKVYVIDNLVRTNSLRNIEHLMASRVKDLSQPVIKFINADVSEFDFDSYFDLKLPSDSDHHISHCFHLAATRINRCSKFNSEGHRYIAGGGFNVVNFCAKNNITLFFASTASVYNKPKKLPIQETDPCTPHTIYGAAKYYTETLIHSYDQMYGLDYVINRFFSVYGERMDNEGAYTEVIWNWLSGIRDGNKKITVFGNPKEKILDLVHVEDVVNAILLSTFSTHKGIYNVSTQKGVSLQELIKVIENVTKIKLEIDMKPETRTDIELERVGDVSKLKELKWEQRVSLEQGIRRTWEWVKTL